MGIRKIVIKKCEDKSKRYITFSKRRNGIISKAAEFSVLYNSKVGIVISSPPGQKTTFYTFGHPSVDQVIDACLGKSTPSTEEDDRVRCLYHEVKELEQELKVEKLTNEMPEGEREDFWWLEDIVKSELIEELRSCIQGLKKLKNNARELLNNSACTTVDNDTPPFNL